MTAGAEVGGTVMFYVSLALARWLGRDDVMARSSGQFVTFDAAWWEVSSPALSISEKLQEVQMD